MVVAALLVVVWPAGQTTTNNVKLTLHPLLVLLVTKE
jgi:hypothetical protein